MGKKCPSYGCPIYPMEMSMLNETSTDFASTNYIMLTHKSNRQKPAPVNQDRIVLIPSFTTDTTSLHDNKNNNNNSGDFFIGLFDGHDDKGHETASYASIEIPSQIASKLQEKSTSRGGEIPSIEMNEIITETFRNVDANAPPIGGGTTAMTVIRIGSKLYLANTGDSTQYIAKYTPPPSFIESKSNHNERYIHNMTRPTKEQLNLQGTISIHYQNKKHKANFPEEKHRIEKLGGRIHIPPNNPMGSRVIVRSATHREDVGLAMSRSIGDWEWTAVGVIPDPDIQVIDLEEFWKANEVITKDSKVFVVLGSDGLFDARRVEFVAKHLAYGWFESSHKSEERSITERMLVVAKKIVNMASPIKTDFYRDDISFVAKVIEL
jgi:serine/threonine protein phosphatase PrpC